MPELDFTIPLVSVSWLSAHLDHPDLVILDATVGKVGIGTKEAFAHQWIKGSRHFDLDGRFSLPGTHLPHMLPSEEHFTREARALGIRQDSLIVVYDKWGIYSAPRPWWMFRAMGHENVAVLDGGYPEWEKRNLPVQSTPTVASSSGNFTAKLQPTLVRNSGEVLNALSDPHQLVLDARPAGRFNGTTPEPRPHLRSGHMPGSVNLPFPDVIEDTTMKPAEILKAKFKELGVKDQELIFSCGSGLTACILDLAANIAGLKNTSVYDGSWSEWGEPGDLPVV